MRYGAIVLAAGSGTRYKGKKQDIEFHGKPLWRYSYDTAMKVVGEKGIVCVGKDFPVEILEQALLERDLQHCQEIQIELLFLMQRVR